MVSLSACVSVGVDTAMSFAKAGEPIEKFRLGCGLGLAQETMYYVGPGSPLGKGQFCGFSHIQMPNGADLASHGIRGSVGPYKSALPQTTHERLSRFLRSPPVWPTYRYRPR